MYEFIGISGINRSMYPPPAMYRAVHTCIHAHGTSFYLKQVHWRCSSSLCSICTQTQIDLHYKKHFLISLTWTADQPQQFNSRVRMNSKCHRSVGLQHKLVFFFLKDGYYRRMHTYTHRAPRHSATLWYVSMAIQTGLPLHAPAFVHCSLEWCLCVCVCVCVFFSPALVIIWK